MIDAPSATPTATGNAAAAPSQASHRATGSRPPLRGNVVDYLFERRMAPDEAARTYLTMPGGDHSFADLYARTCRIGHLLKQSGAATGDRVMFSVRDGIDFVAIFLAAMKIGAISVPINTFLKSKDYAYYLKDSGAKVVIVDAGLAPTFGDALAGVESVRHVFVTNGRVDGFPQLDDAVAGMPETLDTLPRNATDPAFWLYSSGSTGDPKGVVHTHEHIYWATELFGIGTQGVAHDDVILCPLKMFFAFGLGNTVYFPLRAGARVIADPEVTRLDTVLANFIKHPPTIFVAVPTIYAGLLNQMRSMDPQTVRDACRRLKTCVSGGEVLPPSLLRGWREMTGVDILDGVGTTEMTHMFIINRPGQVVPGSCGRLVEGFTARLVDDDWNDVPQGEIGQLFAAGPTAAAEYWNKPERTRRTMRDGGVLTGDKFYQDAQGNFFYVGRNDDMLRVGGIWVSPAEIESSLAEDPRVLECAVIGAADENQMTKPKAYVILRPGNTPSQELAEEMREKMRERLAHYKCPRWIEFVPELPKTATGKIQRFRLRDAQTRAPSA